MEDPRIICFRLEGANRVCGMVASEYGWTSELELDSGVALERGQAWTYKGKTTKRGCLQAFWGPESISETLVGLKECKAGNQERTLLCGVPRG